MDRKRQVQRGNSQAKRRAVEAQQHIADTQQRFAGEIEASIAHVRFFEGIPKKKGSATATPVVPDSKRVAPYEQLGEENTRLTEDGVSADDALQEAQPADEPQLEVCVVDEDAVAAVIARGRGRAQFCDLALLDFASFVSPGGGYARGAWAQEEALCAESTLYNVLTGQKAWYAENRRRNINCNLYRNRAFVVPAVRFTREKLHAFADVIVAAAPFARAAREEYKVTDEQLMRAMRDRIRLVLAIADELGHDKLILGAFGCGAFGWDALAVAELFRAELAEGQHLAKHVIFAIPASRTNENLQKFQHVFAAFPEAPAEPYTVAAQRAAAEQEARAQEDDADDDADDWRYYL